MGKGAARAIAGQIPTFLALLAAATLIFTPDRRTGLALTAIALIAVGWKATTTSFPPTTAAQLMLVFGIISTGVSTSSGGGVDPVAATAGGVLLLLIVLEPAIDGALRQESVSVRHLPGYRQPARPDARLLFLVNLVAIGLLTLLAALHASTWPVALLAVANLVACTLTVARSLAAHRLHGHRITALRAALDRYHPAFALYFSAPVNTEFHVHMWLPYLERIGKPFVIIVREREVLRTLAATTTVPIVFCPTVSDIDVAVTPDMRACFYVNNGAKNTHMVRFHEMTHIQLLHGDSDKASSFNPVTGMFNRIFVAGRAGVDRYAANGVRIPLEKFDIVGRPQVEDVQVVDRRIADVEPPVVLYASTWVGFYTDANYCSLRIGEQIVRMLIDRGATVILRPHPYAYRDAASARRLARMQAILAEDRSLTGRPHVFGAAAQSEMSLLDCMNAADALISDVSGVASDFLYSSKPFALTNMLGADAAEFEASFPLAKAAYVLDGTAANLPAVLDDLLRCDPLASTRGEMRTYYLGDFPVDDYADGFVTTARSYVEPPRVTLITEQVEGVPA